VVERKAMVTVARINDAEDFIVGENIRLICCKGPVNMYAKARRSGESKRNCKQPCG